MTLYMGRLAHIVARPPPDAVKRDRQEALRITIARRSAGTDRGRKRSAHAKIDHRAVAASRTA